MKTEKLNIRISAEDKQLLQLIAEAENNTVANIIVKLARNEAERMKGVNRMYYITDNEGNVYAESQSKSKLEALIDNYKDEAPEDAELEIIEE